MNQQMNVMADNAMIPPPATQARSATDQAAIYSKLQRWVDFLELTANETGTLDQYNNLPRFTNNSDEIRKAKSQKRLNARLRKLELEQKEILLAEAQRRFEEAWRAFDAQEQPPYDYTPRPPSTIQDIFRAEKARNELRALECEQKEQLYNMVMEKRARELGEQWPPAQEMSQQLGFDHIPKPWPGCKEMKQRHFQGLKP